MERWSGCCACHLFDQLRVQPPEMILRALVPLSLQLCSLAFIALHRKDTVRLQTWPNSKSVDADKDAAGSAVSGWNGRTWSRLKGFSPGGSVGTWWWWGDTAGTSCPPRNRRAGSQFQSFFLHRAASCLMQELHTYCPVPFHQMTDDTRICPT